MKRRILTLLLVSIHLMAWSQGVPFLRNYSANEYHAHKQNFDIICGVDGTIYVANFEGLLYYDHASWRIIHTPGVTRVTTLFMDSKGTIWTGGYNYIGRLRNDSDGRLELDDYDKAHSFHGEVHKIWERDKVLYFLASNGSVYQIADHHIKPVSDKTTTTDTDADDTQTLDNQYKAIASNGNGVIIQDNNGNTVQTITEKNGLCSDNVVSIVYNGHGQLWGATDNGIFAIAIPSVYSHFTQNEGLRGEVLSISQLDNTLYVGTLSGLYRRQGHTFVNVADISHACWQLVSTNGRLLAATTDGVYSIEGQQSRQLTTASTTSLLVTPEGFYSGELDGFYLNTYSGQRQRLCDAEKVVKIVKDKSGAIWLQNLYGSIWRGDGKTFAPFTTGQKEAIATLVQYEGRVITVTADATKPFPYPLFSYTDSDGITWLTDNKGKILYAMDRGKRQEMFSELVYPLMDHSVRAMMRDGGQLWIGGEKGLNVVDCSRKDPIATTKACLYIRSVSIDGDSIVWGGYGEYPQQLRELSSDNQHLVVKFSVDYPSLLLPTQYRYRINNGRWTEWNLDTEVSFHKLPYGSYLLEVQSRNAYGVLSDVASINFSIMPPVYMRWYMIVLYLILIVIAVYLLVKLRLRQLEHEKHRLESIVQERTAEVVKQKDEIEEKSNRLETALQELGEAQHELVRQEKMATVGKLTQGLIDRILNPLNYINNFAKLSEGLVKDLTANVEDEQEHMDADNYEDTIDVLGMLKTNLEKVGEHGANTTRTLKAMEEMLKDRSGGIVQMDLTALVKQDEQMVAKYYQRQIADYHIKVAFNYSEQPVFINANAEQLSKTFMSLLNNSIYAITKKVQRQQFSPEVTFTMRALDGQVEIVIRDNGIGIEETIIDKIFDPFFTTKTTGEASGVGLYLSKEIVQNYGGDIHVESKKDQYTEFTIILPTIK